jgi:hypothetical protein
MHNADIIDLFDRVEAGTPVEIVAPEMPTRSASTVVTSSA